LFHRVSALETECGFKYQSFQAYSLARLQQARNAAAIFSV